MYATTNAVVPQTVMQHNINNNKYIKDINIFCHSPVLHRPKMDEYCVLQITLHRWQYQHDNWDVLIMREIQWQRVS